MRTYDDLQILWGLTSKVLTTNPIVQVPWDEFPSKNIETHGKTIQKTKTIIKISFFHGPWPGGGLKGLITRPMPFKDLPVPAA